MSPHGEAFVPQEFREPPRERPAVAGPTPVGRETHSNLVSLAAERKRRREEDARASVDVAIRTAGGNLEVVRQHVEQRLKAVREKIDTLERFDHASQEESEFLKAQRDAIAEHIRANAEAARPEPKIVLGPTPTKAAVETKPQSLMDRVRSGWNGIKARLFGGGSDAAVPDYTGTMTAYEETWSDERLAARAPARETEMARLQEVAIQQLQEREQKAIQRLEIVKNVLAQRGIMTRQKREDLPEGVRLRYAREQSQLESTIREIGSQLRIAEATRRRRDEDERLRA